MAQTLKVFTNHNRLRRTLKPMFTFLQFKIDTVIVGSEYSNLDRPSCWQGR